MRYETVHHFFFFFDNQSYCRLSVVRSLHTCKLNRSCVVCYVSTRKTTMRMNQNRGHAAVATGRASSPLAGAARGMATELRFFFLFLVLGCKGCYKINWLKRHHPQHSGSDNQQSTWGHKEWKTSVPQRWRVFGVADMVKSSVDKNIGEYCGTRMSSL